MTKKAICFIFIFSVKMNGILNQKGRKKMVGDKEIKTTVMQF